jgi:hypothetical protein
VHYFCENHRSMCYEANCSVFFTSISFIFLGNGNLMHFSKSFGIMPLSYAFPIILNRIYFPYPSNAFNSSPFNSFIPGALLHLSFFKVISNPSLDIGGPVFHCISSHLVMDNCILSACSFYIVFLCNLSMSLVFPLHYL